MSYIARNFGPWPLNNNVKDCIKEGNRFECWKQKAKG